MTLTVCLRGTDGLVVAADSRGTFGDPRGTTAQNDTIKKVYTIGNVGISVAGAQNTNLIIEEVANSVDKEQINVTDIMLKVRQTAINKYDEWFKGFPYMPIQGYHPLFVRPQIEISMAGYDNSKSSTPKMFSINSSYNFAPYLYDYGFVLLGVAQYAVYLLNRLYTNEMKVEELKHLSAYVISETATQDGKVGGPIQIAVIKPHSSEMLRSNEIQDIIGQNEKRAEELKKLFKNDNSVGE